MEIRWRILSDLCAPLGYVGIFERVAPQRFEGHIVLNLQ
jgi:hypothetical protein